jgi:hypothetical protein
VLGTPAADRFASLPREALRAHFVSRNNALMRVS